MSGLQYTSVRKTCSEMIDELTNARSNPLEGFDEMTVLYQIREKNERKTLVNSGPRTKTALISLLKYMPLRTADSTIPDYVDFLAANFPNILYEYCVIQANQKESHPLKVPSPQIKNREQNSLTAISARLNLMLEYPKFTEGLLNYYALQSEIKKSESKSTASATSSSKPVDFFGINLAALPQRMAVKYIDRSRQDQMRLTNRYTWFNQILKFVVSSSFGYGKVYQWMFGATTPTLATEISALVQNATLTSGSVTPAASKTSSALVSSPLPATPAARAPSPAPVAPPLPATPAARAPSPAPVAPPLPATPAARAPSPAPVASPLPATPPARTTSPAPVASPATPAATAASSTPKASIPRTSSLDIISSPAPTESRARSLSLELISSPPQTEATNTGQAISPARPMASNWKSYSPATDNGTRASTDQSSAAPWPGSPVRSNHRDISPARPMPAAPTPYSPAAGAHIIPGTTQTIEISLLPETSSGAPFSPTH